MNSAGIKHNLSAVSNSKLLVWSLLFAGLLVDEFGNFGRQPAWASGVAAIGHIRSAAGSLPYCRLPLTAQTG